MEEGELRKEANHEESKICIAGEQIKNLIKRVHDQDNWHIEPINTIQQIFNGPYWWPTIVQDTMIISMENVRSVRETLRLKYNVEQLLPILKKIGELYLLFTYHMGD